MASLKTYDLFISHAWKYGEDYDRLVKMLNNAPLFLFRNYSAPEDKPLQNLDSTDVKTIQQIRDSITRKIAPVNCVIVIAGMYYNHRTWMQYEIEEAKRLSKPIVVVKPYGNSVMPEELTSFVHCNQNCVSVNWNTESIVQAIRQISI